MARTPHLSAPRRIFRAGPLPKARVESFSDGVLAVVITLLVLEIRLPSGPMPEAALWRAVAATGPAILAWAISFAFVMTFWISHHYFFALLRHTDRGLLWLNGLFLFCITLMPFPAGLVGAYPLYAAPVALLSLVMAATAFSFTLMRAYATYHARLIDIDPDRARRSTLQSALAPALYLIAFVFAFICRPAAVAIQVCVLAFFVFRSAGGPPTAGAEVA